MTASDSGAFLFVLESIRANLSHIGVTGSAESFFQSKSVHTQGQQEPTCYVLLLTQQLDQYCDPSTVVPPSEKYSGKYSNWIKLQIIILNWTWWVQIPTKMYLTEHCCLFFPQNSRRTAAEQ